MRRDVTWQSDDDEKCLPPVDGSGFFWRFTFKLYDSTLFETNFFLENVYAMTQHILDDVEVSRCQRNVTWPNVTQHIQHILNEMTRWRDDADAPNKSKTELVRSTIFLVLAWCPGCQGSKTITSGPIGPRVPSGSNLKDLLKFLANLFTFRFTILYSYFWFTNKMSTDNIRVFKVQHFSHESHHPKGFDTKFLSLIQAKIEKS